MNTRIIDFHAHVAVEAAADELLSRSGPGLWRHVIVSGNLIDPARLGDFLRGDVSPLTYEPNNDLLLDLHGRNPERLIPFFTVDPNFDMPSDIDRAVSAGFQGFKLNPIVHRAAFLDAGSLELFACIPEGCPVYLHLTLNPASNLAALEELARRFRRVNWIIGHMGYASSDLAAIEAASKHENIHLETSLGSRLALKEMKRRRLAGKLLFGSEFPTQDPRTERAKLELIFDESELESICASNAEALFAWRARLEV